MRLPFIIIFSLVSVTLFAQTASPIVQASKLYEYRNGLRIDSAAFMPRRDTFTADPAMKAPGMLLYSLSDSIMYYRNSFAWKPLFSAASVATIYTQDGTLTGARQIHQDGHQLLIIDDGSSYGETKFNMSANGAISLTAKAPAGDPNGNYPGVMTVSPYETYIGCEGINQLTHAQSDSVSSRFLFNKFSDIDAHAGYENKAGVDDAGFFVTHGFMDHPSIVNTTLLRVDSTGNTSTLKLSSHIHNAFNTSGTVFTSYYNLSHDGVDTSKKIWSIGLMGTPTAPGPGGDAGDSLKIRAYTTTGGVLADLMTLSRTGPVYIPGQLTLGAVNGSLIKLLVNGGSVFNKDIVVSGFNNKSYASESKIVTPTGDYTVLQTDLYVNVNNSTNCTITLPLSNFGVFHIKKISNNAATVTIIGPNGTELIDGSTSYIMSSFNDHANIHQNDATNYFIY